MSELPEGWAIVALPHVADVLDARRMPLNANERSQRVAGKGTGALVPYYGATGQAGWIDEALFEEKLVLLGEDGAPFLDPQKPKAYRITGKSWVNNHAHVLRAREGVLDWRLLEGQLNSTDYTGFVTGTTRLKLTQGAMNTLPILLPPFQEQIRIANKLDTLLARVQACNDRFDAIPALLKRFRQTVLDAATSGRLTEDWRNAQPNMPNADSLIEALAKDVEAAGGHIRGNASEPTEEAHDLTAEKLPKGWQISTLKDCCTPGRPITYGILKPGPELEDGIPYIRVADFPGNQLKLAGIKKTSPEIDLQFKRARLIAGDLLLSIRGSVGRLIEIPAVLEGANITQDTARLSINKRLNSRYVHYVLLAPDTQRRMANAIRGVAVRGINIGDVRALQLPIPSSLEQTEIVRRVEAMFSLADRIDARCTAARAQAQRLTPLVLAKAFRGELVPQDPNDEPANELLARIGLAKTAAAIKLEKKTPVGRKQVARKTAAA